MAITDSTGTLISQQRYSPFGQVRTDVTSPNSPATDFGFTGQRNLNAQGNVSLGLMDYNARMYDSLLTRFIQPDNLISGFADPQTWNRYAYVLNNPIDTIDPSGNDPWGCLTQACITREQSNYKSSSGSGDGFDPTLGGGFATSQTSGSSSTGGQSGSGGNTKDNLSVTQLVKQFQQDQGPTEYCSSFAISTALNMLYGIQTTGEDVVTDFTNPYGNVNPASDLLSYWPSLSWDPNGSAVLPNQIVNIVNQDSSKILGQSNDLPVAEEKMMSPTELIQSISNPNQEVLFTFNTSTGNWSSGHTVVLAAYDPKADEFGFLNSGALKQPNDLTWITASDMQKYINDPIGLWEPNFVVITRP